MTKDKPANLLSWLADILTLEDPERIEIIDNILYSYLHTCEEELPEYFPTLFEYLNEEPKNQEDKEMTVSNLWEFKKAINNINVAISMTFTVDDQPQFQQAIRRLLMDSRHDSSHAKTMKLYYLEQIDRDDLSGIVFNDQEYQIVADRIDYLKDEYLKISGH